MVNSLLNSITRQLGTKFGTDYHYYVESVRQGLQKPCFTVITLEPHQRSRSPVLYDRTIPVVVHYFTDQAQDNVIKDCYAVAEEVVECLEYLPFKNTTLRGEDVSWQITDDVLQVFITYRFTTTSKVGEETYMEDSIETLVSNKQ